MPGTSRDPYPVTVGAPAVAGGSGGGKGYDEIPRAECCYSNENDPRACVCIEASCGRRDCVPNLGHPQGKLIAVVCYGVPIVVLIIWAFISKG